ncbi:MAG TPA: chemotaxis protein CheW [Desulfuromonadales bacterium]|nr:chemotaxis protein CheW [Desulfuromonadales bacterium]
MDLAKIRKKSLLTESPSTSPALPVPLRQESTAEPAPGLPAGEPPFGVQASQQKTIQQPAPLLPGISTSAAVLPVSAAAPAAKIDHRTPIEIILAGRQSAGCQEYVLPEDDAAPTLSDDQMEFLCFRVSDELYGINIMDIKEIIKPREVTEVPRAPAFVSGILSLRGTIITVIDMRLRLGLDLQPASGRERVVVVRNGDSLCGLLVDEVTQVVRIAAEGIEAAPAVLDGIDRDFVSGIGRSGGKFIIILHLEHIADIHLY